MLAQLSKIGVNPGELGSLGARGGKHVEVGVDADHPIPAAGQLDGDPTRAAAGVEDAVAAGLPQQALDEVGLTMDGRTRLGEPRPSCVVTFAAGRVRVLPSSTHRRHHRKETPRGPVRVRGVVPWGRREDLQVTRRRRTGPDP